MADIPVPLVPMSERLRGEVQGSVMAAGAIDALVTDLFYTWAAGRVREDPKTRDAVGLELLADFKAAKPALFAHVEAPPSKSKKRIVVDEDRERNIPIGISTYTFRPGQTINDPYILALAKEHQIALREK